MTGGAGIYGAHITRALAEAGARAVIASRGVDHCNRLVAEMRDSGLDVVAAPLDLSSKESILALRDWIVDHFGRLDILFNNAVARSGGDMSSTSEEDWETTMKVIRPAYSCHVKSMAKLWLNNAPESS